MVAIAVGCGLLLSAGCAAGTAGTAASTGRTTATESTGAATSPSTAATAGTSTSPSPSTSAPPAFDGVVVDVTIAAGEVVTSDERVIVTLGTVVRMVVTSDIDEEVHVHGIDEYVDLQAGQTATHEFTASIPGTFEVEMHGSGDLLFTLQIQP